MPVGHAPLPRVCIIACQNAPPPRAHTCPPDTLHCRASAHLPAGYAPRLREYAPACPHAVNKPAHG
ncbi:hypothetical protein HanRHA438_Chr14g0652771 [Helianthus annuus]|nr:hypothetical protein HanIR_Chr14g0696651 [Helianthus annuus]KAJ0853574.1 hypothetical protein HanRHA438_Chr14g0652771 [Helianthus annuus]